MQTLSEFIEDSAKQLIIDVGARAGNRLNMSEQSLSVVEELLDEAAAYVVEWQTADRQRFVELFGCYILEVARKAFGGHYIWHDGESAPVLIVGDAQKHVALLTWPRVAGRVGGDEADNIPFFYEGFAERARGPVPDCGVLYV